MKILYVTGSNLSKNTSANMSHNGYVQGLLENGVSLDIIMAGESYGEEDTKLKRWDGVHYFVYPSLSRIDKVRKHGRNVVKADCSIAEDIQGTCESFHFSIKQQIRRFIKKLFYFIFKPDPIYTFERVWLTNARKFSCKKEYDLIVSNSSPAASHKLVEILLKKQRIRCKRWIQIWEDPWYHDLYGGHPDAQLKEEHSLLQIAQEIYYVSPLTLHYQKLFFPDCANKMHFVPLPFLKFSKDNYCVNSDVSFGYFGDYYSYTRNLQPFYEALITTSGKGYIFGIQTSI